jgi:hypothetical protein
MKKTDEGHLEPCLESGSIIRQSTWKAKYRSKDNTKNGKRENCYQKMKRSLEERLKHTETYLIHLDYHRCLSQSEESECM